MAETALQKVEKQIEILEPRFQELSMEVKAEVQFKQEAHFALQALQKNDYLMKVALQNPQSLKDAILNVASVGLTLNPVAKQAYLIPRDGKVVLDISYMGLCDIATQEGALDMIQSRLVYKEDDFMDSGIGKAPEHKYKPFDARGPVVGVYVTAKTPRGDFITEIMSIEECHSIRDRTDMWKKYKKGPWKTDEGEMMKKTVIKRASKTWPKPSNQSRLNAAVDVLNAADPINFDSERDVTPQKEPGMAAEEPKTPGPGYEFPGSPPKRTKDVTPPPPEQDPLEQALTMEKQELINQIFTTCSEMTQGFTKEEKRQFGEQMLNISDFRTLQKMEPHELEDILNRVNRVKENWNNDLTNEPPH